MLGNAHFKPGYNLIRNGEIICLNLQINLLYPAYLHSIKAAYLYPKNLAPGLDWEQPHPIAHPLSDLLLHFY